MENQNTIPLLWVILLGFIGGLIPDVLRLIKAGRNGGAVPQYLTRPMFLVSVILSALLGAFVAWLMGATASKEAVAYGFAGPELITRLVGSFVNTDHDRSEGESEALESPVAPAPQTLSLWKWWVV